MATISTTTGEIEVDQTIDEIAELIKNAFEKHGTSSILFPEFTFSGRDIYINVNYIVSIY